MSLVPTYLEKREALTGFFTARTGSVNDAEDIVQEIYAKIAKLDSGNIQNPVAYLYRVGMNILLDRKRATMRRNRLEASYSESNSTYRNGEQIDDSPDMETHLASRQMLARLLEATSQMPPKRQRVFRLHKLDGLTHVEVARELKISRSAVEKHMILALRDLAAVMK